jgi:hypothetical protein
MAEQPEQVLPENRITASCWIEERQTKGAFGFKQIDRGSTAERRPPSSAR